MQAAMIDPISKSDKTMSSSERPDGSRKLLLALVACAALTSLLVGIKHAFLYGSHDLQWMGGRLLSQHIDPWKEELSHNPNHFAHFSPPNYLHALYLLWLPFSRLRFISAEVIWVALTILLSMGSILILKRLFHLSWLQTSVALCCLWMSSPFRVVLEVGQMSCFELFFLSASFMAASEALRGLALGVSLVKYSFSPAAVLLFLFRRRFRLLACAGTIPLIGLFGAWMLLSTPLHNLVLEPLAVSSAPTAVSPGFADLMTVMESSTPGVSAVKTTAYIFGIVASAGYAFFLNRYRLTRATELTLVSLASLLFVTHLIYDYVFLLPVLCFALIQPNRKHKAALAGAVAMFWFVLPKINHTMQADLDLTPTQLIANCSLLTGLMVYTTYLGLATAESAAHVTIGTFQTIGADS